MAARTHLANGEPCFCDMAWSEDPTAYAAAHPNRKDKNGTTFNDEVASSIATSNAQGSMVVV